MPLFQQMSVADDNRLMRHALALAARAFGDTSPNPMVGAIIVKSGRVIGRGWHKRAGEPHAEIEALRDATARGHNVRGGTIYVTLEPCSTTGRTPPCTNALIEAGLRTAVIGAIDPNPKHAGAGLKLLATAGLTVRSNILAAECAALNEPWNHWITNREPFVTLKCAMSLDGKIATKTGESKWITSEKSRAFAMRLRQSVDAIIVGVNTIIADDPSLTIRLPGPARQKALRRIILDSEGRIPLNARVLTDDNAALTTVVVRKGAKISRGLCKVATILEAPASKGRPDLRWLMRHLGQENVTHLLVEGGGEVNAAFFECQLPHRVVFFYAPKVIGGAGALKAVGGEGVARLEEAVQLHDVAWRKLGPDLVLEAKTCYPK